MEPYYAIVIKAFFVRPTLINSSLWSDALWIPRFGSWKMDTETREFRF